MERNARNAEEDEEEGYEIPDEIEDVLEVLFRGNDKMKFYLEVKISWSFTDLNSRFYIKITYFSLKDKEKDKGKYYKDNSPSHSRTARSRDDSQMVGS